MGDMDLAKPNTWLLVALSAVTFAGFFYGFLTLAGGGIFIVALSLPVWIALLFYARRSRAVAWIAAVPILLYGLLLAAGLIVGVLR